MSKNMSSLILEEVSKTNRNKYNFTKEVLREDSYHLDPRFDRAQSFYGKAKIEDNGDEITLISYSTPIIKVKDGKFEVLCSVDDLTHTTMRHVRDFLKQMDYDGKINLSGSDYPITRKWVIDHMNELNEEVTIDNNVDVNTDNNTKTEINWKEEEKKLLDDVTSVDDEALKKFYSIFKDQNKDKFAERVKKELDRRGLTESTILKEAPEDEELPEEEFELNTEEDIVEPDTNQEEMSDIEIEDEIKDDKEDTFEDEIELPFYATIAEYDELRDLLVDLDYRLFLINDNMVCIGRLNGPDIEFLTSNRPENNDIDVSEQNDKAEEIEIKAEEDGEDAYEYKWIKAPDTLDKFLNQVNVLYLSPEMSEEDKEQYAGLEANHESVMNYLMNELPEDKRKEKEDVEEEEIEDIEEPIEEIPEETEEEFDIEEEDED